MAEIKYQTGIPKISAYWDSFVKAALDKFGIKTLTISSTYRNPRSQAVAMYNNVVSLGVASQKALYTDAGDKIIDVYDKMSKAKASKEDILKAMEAKIVELKFYGAHGSTNPDFVCFDVPPNTMTVAERPNFEKCMKSIASKFLSPFINIGEPVYHIEIKKGVLGVIDKSSKIIPILVIIITGYMMYKRMKG